MYVITFRSAMWDQQHLLLLYDSMPGVLRRPCGSFGVRANRMCGGMSVRLWLCPERPRLCALQPVWMHLPRSLLCGEAFDACNILQVKGFDVTNKTLHLLIMLLWTLQLKETFVTDDCSLSCECTTTGAVCQAKSCGDNEICTVYETKRDCYKSEHLIEITLLLKHVINEYWIFWLEIYLINISCIAWDLS